MKHSGRIAELDGLRGMAILSVVGLHSHWLPGGRAGVDIFFALSGYLITGILLREHAREGSIDLANFYLRRAARLLPALLVFLVLIGAWSQLQSPLFLIPDTHAIGSSLLYFANWQIAWLAPAHEPLGPLTHTWSLSIEEQFYLAWPLLLGVGLKLKWRRVQLLALTSLAVLALTLWRLWLHYHGAPHERLYFATDTHSEGLLIGCALALMPASLSARSGKIAPMIWPVAIAVLLALFLLPFRGTVQGWLGITAAAGSAAVLIWAIPHSQRLQGILRQPVLVWLGLRSYSLYLWHFPVFWREGVLSFLPVPQPIVVLLEIGLSLLLAEASYRWIEQPGLRLNNLPLRATYRPAANASTD